MSIRQAFKIGFLFDITVASYALLIPYILLSIEFIHPKTHERLFKIVRLYCCVALLVSLIICAADVPYFNFFNSRLNTAAIALKNIGQSIRYIFQEPKYYPFLIIIFVFIWGTGKIVRSLWNRAWKQPEQHEHQRVSTTALATLVMLCSLWGGATPKKPDMKSATFSNDGFMNQLTLNPVHTWFDSYFDFEVFLFKIDDAIANIKSYYKIPKASFFESPVARSHHYETSPKEKMNVVVILMESMSAHRTGILGNTKLTPGLDSLAKNSVFFENCYSNGIHTNAGIYSTLYGLPIMMMQHPMTNGRSEFTQFSGLPVALKSMGYQTSFYCTHPKKFDNLDIFLNRNGYEYISDQFDYPKEKVTNSWGVSDEALFEEALANIDSMTAKANAKPFFTTLLTITAHPPFTIPADTKFKPRSTDQIEITFEYADWAVKNFMDACATKPWYKNTIFVLLGDHGVNLPSEIDVPLSYNHIPLIIHAPGIYTKPQVRSQLANQTDVFPTVMGMLANDYVQNSMGYDLFREKRPFAFFSQDHKLGVINEEYLYVARKSGRESLYQYRSKGKWEDLADRHPQLVDSMKNYACSHLQVSQWMIERQLTK